MKQIRDEEASLREEIKQLDATLEQKSRKLEELKEEQQALHASCRLCLYTC